jgi:Flp pilus assembly protein TadB
MDRASRILHHLQTVQMVQNPPATISTLPVSTNTVGGELLAYTPLDDIPGIVTGVRNTYDSGITRKKSWYAAYCCTDIATTVNVLVFVAAVVILALSDPLYVLLGYQLLCGTFIYCRRTKQLTAMLQMFENHSKDIAKAVGQDLSR